VVIAGIFEAVDAVVHYFLLAFTHQEESVLSMIVAALAIAALLARRTRKKHRRAHLSPQGLDGRVREHIGRHLDIRLKARRLECAIDKESNNGDLDYGGFCFKRLRISSHHLPGRVKPHELVAISRQADKLLEGSQSARGYIPSILLAHNLHERPISLQAVWQHHLLRTAHAGKWQA
jgi:hypothetical protein